jgi:hypothetical protein
VGRVTGVLFRRQEDYRSHGTTQYVAPPFRAVNRILVDTDPPAHIDLPVIEAKWLA